MKLSEHEHRRLLPLFMRKDGTAEGLAAGISEVVRKIDSVRPLLRKWDQIDNMTHEQLDEMAWELNVLWYDAAAALETKRRLIKNSDKVYSRLGTKWAVEEVVSAYLGDAKVYEFWEYEDGRPHYFKVMSENPRITTDLEEIFLRALDVVKRKSQWLDKIGIELRASGSICAGVAFHDVSIETVRIVRFVSDMDPPAISTTVGIGYHEVATETHVLKGGG